MVHCALAVGTLAVQALPCFAEDGLCHPVLDKIDVKNICRVKVI